MTWHERFPSAYRSWGKRLLDVLLATAALVVLAPVFMAVALLVRFKLGPKALFRQQRPGRFGRPFHLLKFRTMTLTRGPSGELLSDADRLTPMGQFLRSTSLDELPELLNVLRGEMSLVGPRPLLTEYLPLYSPEQMRRHEVRPGITGWAQVNGRNAISWREKLAFDVWYVDNYSGGLDLKILLRTLGTVFRRQGITGENEATVSKFTGEN